MPDLSAPLPPLHLASRAGPGIGQSALEAFDREGASVRRQILRLLPPDWPRNGAERDRPRAQVLRRRLRR